MLFEAFFWDPSQYRPEFEGFKQDPEFGKLLEDWGRAGDQAVIAEEATEMPVGAAWYRYWTPERHSYGFVDAKTRRRLALEFIRITASKASDEKPLQALIETAREEGVSALSLSVAPDNFALKLYKNEGFTKVGESGTSWTLLLQL